jgi:nitrate/nitrite transporter NarK
MGRDLGPRLLRIHKRFSGQLDVVEALPPLDRVQRAILPVADLFMTLMVSRPVGGSLRSVRVSSETIALASLVAVALGGVGIVLAMRGATTGQIALVMAAALALGLALAAASVSVFGIRQRSALDSARQVSTSGPRK